MKRVAGIALAIIILCVLLATTGCSPSADVFVTSLDGLSGEPFGAQVEGANGYKLSGFSQVKGDDGSYTVTLVFRKGAGND